MEPEEESVQEVFVPPVDMTNFGSFEIEDWTADGLCFEISDERKDMRGAWINEEHPQRELAALVCEDCPVRRLCFTTALEERWSDDADKHLRGKPSAQGLRGGYYFDDGRLMKSDLVAARKQFKINVRLSPSNVRDAWVKKEDQ